MYGKVEHLDIYTIEEKITPLDIFAYYVKNFKNLGENFSSEFRRDNTPSARIYEGGDTYWYKDYGEPGKPLNCYQYVMRKYGLNFNDALRRINFDFNLKIVDGVEPPSMGFLGTSVTKELEKSGTAKKDVYIKKKTKQFSIQELDWWRGFGWNTELLNFYKVVSCSHATVVMDGKSLVFHSSPQNPVYVFDYTGNIRERKMYRPLSPSWKWAASSNISLLIQGYDQLDDTGDILIITSSLKDVGTLRRIGYNAVAASSENTLIKREDVEHLKTRFKILITYLDNDQGGILASEVYSQLYGIKGIRNESKEKDPSDLYKSMNNFDKFKEYVDGKIAKITN